MNKTANITAVSLAPARSRPSEPAKPTSSFDEKVTIETAEQLLRGSGQYNRWQSLRQKNDNSALLVAGSLLERHRLLMADKNGEQVNWTAFDDLTHRLSQSGIHLHDSSFFQKQSPVFPTAPVASKKISSSAPLLVSVPLPIVSIPQASSAKSLLNEEDSLIFNMTCAPIALQETAFGYGDDEITLLPLGELSAALDLKIDVDAGRGTASGWFISEDRTFSLDINRKTIRIGETDIPWQKDSVFSHDGEMYVDSRILSTWLPLDFDISRAELTVDVIPREKLPLQARMEREQRWLRLNGQGDEALKYPVRKLEYELFSMPVMDVSMSGGIGDKGLENAELQSRFSILGRGDLFYMNSHLYVSGFEDEPLNIARIRLERFDPEGALLGSLSAKQISLGDIIPANFPILSNPSPERGVFISDSDMVRRADFDVTTFEGNVLPGWEVELYYNGNLIDSTLVRADGRYLFEEVPLFYGNNAFKVLAYGPQGQEKILEETVIPVGLDMLPQGETQYDLSLSQRKKTVFGIDEQDIENTDNNARFRGKYKVGATDSISLAAGIASVEFEGERHNYIQGGLSGNGSFMYAQVDGLLDSAGGMGLSLFGQTTLGPFDVKARHEWFDDMIMENRPTDVLRSKTQVDINGIIPETSVTPPFSYLLSSENTRYQDSSTANMSGRLSTNISRLHVTNSTSWFYDNDKESDADLIEGRLQASGHISQVRLIGVMDYDVGTENSITRYGLSGHWSVTNRLSGGFDLIRDDDYYDRTTASINMDWDSGPVTVSPRLSYDSDGHYGAFLSLSFSVGPDPALGGWDMYSEKRANSGVATAKVYYDANNNQIYDDGDELLPDVRVVASQAGVSASTNDTGSVALSGLSPFRATDIEIDEESLEDPFWQPSLAGVAIRPRPGRVDHVELPVVSTGEVDGTLFSLGVAGTTESLSNVLLELLNEEGELVQKTRSEYDGFYLFEKVFPGEYTLRVSPEDSLSALAVGQEKDVRIANDGTIVSGMDMFFFKDKPSLTGTVALQQQVESIPNVMENVMENVAEDVLEPAPILAFAEEEPIRDISKIVTTPVLLKAEENDLVAEAESVERNEVVASAPVASAQEQFRPFQVMPPPIEAFISERGQSREKIQEAPEQNEYREIIARIESMEGRSQRQRQSQTLSAAPETGKQEQNALFEVMPPLIAPFNPLGGDRIFAGIDRYQKNGADSENANRSGLKVLG